ncbi:leucine-rich repeat and WD repeat-containing protein 1-like [Saccostrea echinata]|uniref:leucine-rich repeat and WD repeat-containing protein 1-like n=1 Tax=Saccostrea echinata TaxID=191078 RepID=UPI002A81D22B|nr:leucine-rich repeat and WD repeat-containing protein 1-like [Saccostrea echinata]
MKQVKSLSVGLIGQVEGSQRLPTIRSLMLSDYGLEELPTDVLKHMKTLKVLDLSCNNLTTFPDVTLKTLETLDISENNIKSVDFVRNLPSLRHLMLEGNPNIQDNHMIEAVLKCPSLMKIDKHNVDYIHRQIQNFREKWLPQVQAKFEVLFEDRFTEEMSEDQFLQAVTEFQDVIRADSLFSSANSEAEKIVIDKLAKEIAEDARSGELFSTHQQAPGTPRSVRLSRKLSCNTPKTPSSTSTTPKRNRRSMTSVLDSPTLKMPESPISPISTPNKRKRRRDSDEESGVQKSKRDRKYSPLTWMTRKNPVVEHNMMSLPALPDYDPVHFLRCHSEGNDPSDEVTKVWKCAFEPSIEDPEKTTNLLASCGGQTVCLTDCNTGKVMKRYKDDNKHECFYTLAWTTVRLENNKQEKTNLLAVAGQSADIKLIHPSQFMMYATLEGHRKYISCLTFHPKQPTILFSGSNDRKIIVWDIGIPDMRDYTVLFKKLHVLQAPDTDALNLVLSMPSQTLLAGCEDSCFGWKADNVDKLSRTPDYQFYLPTVSSDTESNVTTQRETVDGLAALQNGYVVTKCVGDDIISVWNVKDQLPSKVTSISDKSKVKTSTKSIGVKPTALLHYTRQTVDYINIGATKEMMVVGDDDGKLRLYNVGKVTSRKSKPCDDILQPSRVLEWPEISDGPMKPFCQKETVVVNSACASYDKEYIACGTDNNLVCVWRRQRGSCGEEDMNCD